MRACSCNQFSGPSKPWTGQGGSNCSVCFTIETNPHYAQWALLSAAQLKQRLGCPVTVVCRACCRWPA